MRSISAQATERCSRRFRAVGALAAALIVAGCGGTEGDDGETGAEPVGQELGGSVSQLVQCSDWNGASEAERIATIEDVRIAVNSEDTGVESPTLSDSEAMEVFDNGCDRPEAAGFRLYVMYSRAVAFKSLRDIAEGDVTAPSD